MAYKRKRVYAPRKTYRKRSKKTVYKRRRGTSYTSQSGRLSNTLFLRRRRKWSGRKVRSALWKASQDKNKFRSFLTISDAIGTPASYTTKTIKTTPMIFLGSGTDDPFWTTDGGAVHSDPDLTLPVFSGNSIILRGGKFMCTVENPTSNGQPVKVELYIVWTKNNPELTPITTTPRDRAWTPNLTPDITDCGTCVLAKSGIVNAGEAISMEYPLKIQKIDDSEYASFGRMPILVTCVNALETNTSINVRQQSSYSLSFCGDAT